MGLLDPTPPPYDALAWAKKPFAERARMVCAAWALQGYGSPPAVYAAYLIKVVAYVATWIAFCRTSPELGDISSIARWWLHPLAFQKAIVLSMLFEVLGLGCGSGPLTGRYFPPLGGFLYFLRPGTTKLPLFPGAPLVGGRTRSLVDVLLYAALVGAAVRALYAPSPELAHLLPLVVLLPVLGVLDKTIFLAARAEHFGVMLLCFVATPNWIPLAMAVQLALWFWAGFSKLNHHFPTVACVMTSNGPLTRAPALRKRMYRRYPDDLRPSKIAEIVAHAGTALELAVPIAFLLTPLGTFPLVALVLMFALHAYITLNVPMGVPLEWNVIVAYGGVALFGAHPDVSVLSALTTAPSWLLAIVALCTIALPLAANLMPSRISFLLGMRYYAGNWAYSVWLFKGDSHEKLGKLTRSSAWIYDQLARFYDRRTSVGLIGKVMAFRLMHLHGRVLPILLPKAIDRLEDYEWIDGEMVAGMVLGWNFGEGHLHQEQLLASVQAQCSFDDGELRCIFVESQPLGSATMSYRVVDAKRGSLEAGELPVSELRGRQPWEAAAAGNE